jgi:hypothetical protein
MHNSNDRPKTNDLVANADQMRTFLKHIGVSDRIVERAIQARFHIDEPEDSEPPSLRHGRPKGITCSVPRHRRKAAFDDSFGKG